MKPPLLTKITLEGYKSFRKLELELRPLNVLIGANGVGKSNLVSFFKLLNAVSNRHLQRLVAETGGADGLLRYGEKVTKIIWMRIEFGPVSYEAQLSPDSTDSLLVSNERYKRPPVLAVGEGEEDTLEINPSFIRTRESVLWMFSENARTSAHRGDIFDHIELLVNNIQIYHFHDTTSTAAIKGWGRLNDNIELRSDGENLAAILFKIRTQNLKAYQTICDVIRSVAPYFDDFILRPNPLNMDTIRLEWREHDSDYPFIARDLSDGTLRFMALTTLLLQPEPPAIIVIDEPELGLHPFAIEKLAGLLKIASSRAQLIVATQSPQLIAALEPEDIIVADRKDGETTMQRLNAENLKDWLEEYTLGELWQKNILGGVVNPNNVRSKGNS